MVKLFAQPERKKNIDLMQQYLLNEQGLALKKISNNISAEGVMANSRPLIYFSYFPYILYKVLTQPHIIHSPKWVTDKRIILEYFDSIEKKDLGLFISEAYNFLDLFKESNRDLYYYMKNIFDKAKIKKASYCMEHGLSLNQALALTDANRTELIRYANISKINYDLGQDIMAEKVGVIEDFFKN